MIYTFSGTGNSAFVAKKIAGVTGDEQTNLNELLIREHNQEPSGFSHASDTLIFCVPTYAWRIPQIVENWIRRQNFASGAKTWFVMTCGGEIGDAAQFCQRLCKEKGLTYMGTAQILMPENYIAMFNAPKEEEAKKIVAEAAASIEQAAGLIREKKSFPAPRCNLYDRAMSALINPVFYRVFLKDKAFTAKDACTSCGICIRNCPLCNIKLKNGKPQWNGNCTHCMACITLCPQKAIEYGKSSIGKPRYRCPEVR